ncbi:hypothetical protein QTP88_010585 [Uroleucon formosanum]
MLKSRLDWWLESNSILPTNLFAFRKGMGTMECLSTFIGKIYHSFNNKEFFVATFVDIRGAFDCVNISTLISHLLSLQVPTLFCNILSSLFKHRNLFFSSPFGATNTRSTFTDLPRGSCLSPILFNVYMSIVEKHLSSRGHQCLIYADDLVIFTSNKHLNLAIENLNLALKDLSEILTKVSFEIAPEKSKSVIFSRRRYLNNPDILIDDIIIPIVPNVTYLGIILDSKLRWLPHINSLTAFVSRWSNFLRTITGTWWGSHPSSLLSIYLSIIRAKLDYGCFLYGSASYTIWKKINKHQTSCLRTIIGYVRSTSCPAIEALCPPFNIRCRWLAGKFLLKSLSHTDHHIFDTFYSLYLNWRYVPKSMPVLSVIANILSVFHQYVMSSDKPPIYEQSYDSLLYSPPVHLGNLFSELSSKDLKNMSHCMSIMSLFQIIYPLRLPPLQPSATPSSRP